MNATQLEAYRRLDAWLDENYYAGARDDLREVARTTPAQGLDAATIERCARYIGGHGGVIPGTAVFASLVSGNNQPCMSGDPRDRLLSHRRRAFDDATRSLATAIRALNTASTTTRGEDARLQEALEEMCAAAEYWAGCNEGCSPDEASSEIMSSGGAMPSLAYDKARAALQGDAAHTSQEKGDG